MALLALIVQSGSLSAEALAATPPSIESLGASKVTEVTAVLEATIDPVEGGAYYQFQIATSPSEFASEILCPAPEEPSTMPNCDGTYSEDALPIGEVWGEAQSVELDLNDAGVALEPGTTYYYRVIAAHAADDEGDEAFEWEEPIVFAKSRSFTTEGGEELSVPPMLSEPASMPARTFGLRPLCRYQLVRRNGKLVCMKPRFCRVPTAAEAFVAASTTNSRPSKGVVLLIKERTVSAGRRMYARLANFRDAAAGYGRAFSIDRWASDGWEEDPSSPEGPWPKSMGRLAPGDAGACYVFRAPAAQEIGIYRFSTGVQLSPGTKRGLALRSVTFRVR